MYLRKTSKADGSSQRSIYDHRNRLVRVSSWDGSDNYIGRVDFDYDTFNRMVKREDRSDSQTVIDNYFAGYDGINPTLEFEKVGGGEATRQDLQHRYWWGPQVDQLFADEQISDVSQAGEVLWALPDHLGTIRDIAQFDGTSFEIVNHRRYDSFGNLTGQTDPNYSIAFGYTGKYFDAYSGLSHHWNRWYDPQLGKWISEDPIGFRAGDDNKYRFVGNKINSFVDPDGLREISVFHMTDPDNLPSIVQQGLKPGNDGFIWTAEIPGKGLPETTPKTVGLTLEIDPKELKIFEVGEVEDKTFSKLANKMKWNDQPTRSLGDIKWELIANSAKDAGADVIKVVEEGGSIRYGFTEEGWKKANPKLKGIFGKGAERALETLYKAWNNPEIARAAENTIPGKLTLAARLGGKVVIFIGVGYDLYEIYSSEDRTRTVVKNVAGWAGATAGAKFGAMVGGGIALGAGQMGPQALAPEEIVTVPLGGIIGGLAGGIGGYFGGSSIAETVYDWTFSEGIPANGIQ